jgi:hypothetical protein
VNRGKTGYSGMLPKMNFYRFHQNMTGKISGIESIRIRHIPTRIKLLRQAEDIELFNHQQFCQVAIPRQ